MLSCFGQWAIMFISCSSQIFHFHVFRVITLAVRMQWNARSENRSHCVPDFLYCLDNIRRLGKPLAFLALYILCTVVSEARCRFVKACHVDYSWTVLIKKWNLSPYLAEINLCPLPHIMWKWQSPLLCFFFLMVFKKNCCFLAKFCWVITKSKRKLN